MDYPGKPLAEDKEEKEPGEVLNPTPFHKRRNTTEQLSKYIPPAPLQGNKSEQESKLGEFRHPTPMFKKQHFFKKEKQTGHFWKCPKIDAVPYFDQCIKYFQTEFLLNIVLFILQYTSD